MAYPATTLDRAHLVFKFPSLKTQKNENQKLFWCLFAFFFYLFPVNYTEVDKTPIEFVYNDQKYVPGFQLIARVSHNK